MNRLPSLLALLALTACDTESAAPYAPALDTLDTAEYAPDRVLVGFDAPVPDRLSGRGMELPLARSLRHRDVGVFTLPEGVTVRQALETLHGADGVAWVEPDYILTAAGIDDPDFGDQWSFDTVAADDAWKRATGQGITVAVIDSGVSDGGTDGIDTILDGYDFVNSDSDATDDYSHGTHVAGTIAQSTHNGIGVAGLAWDADILPIKVLDSLGRGYTSDVSDSVDYAVAEGADVINLSLGGGDYSATLESAIQDAWDAGVFVAASSGNDFDSTVNYPAAYSGAVAVGATTSSNAKATYSNTGSALDLAAPGDGIIQETISRSGFDWVSKNGTSMAAPHVAASAALLMSLGATNEEALDYLIDTAMDLGGSGWDSSFGHGLIQPADALEALTDDLDQCAGYEKARYKKLLDDDDSDTISESSSGDFEAYLIEPDEADYKLKLQEKKTLWGMTYWSTVETSDSGSTESISYSDSGLDFRWKVSSNSGHGSYVLCTSN